MLNNISYRIFNQNLYRNAKKNIFFCSISSVSASKPEKFQSKILRYFESKLDCKNYIETESKDNEKFIAIYKSIINLPENLTSSNKNEIHDKFHNFILDLMSLDTPQILCLLSHSVSKPQRQGLTEKFYTHSMSILLQRAVSGALSQDEIIQVIYYATLRNEKASSILVRLNQFVPFFNNINDFEKAVISQSFYKTSLKIFPDQAKILAQTLEFGSENVVEDTFILVSICKGLRRAYSVEGITLKNFSKSIVKSKQPFTLTVASHVILMYDAVNILEPEAINRLIKDSINFIKHAKEVRRVDKNKDPVRLKDLSRTVYCLAKLGVSLSLEEKFEFRESIKDRLYEYCKEDNVGILVSALLSLHILRCWDPKILVYCFQNNIFDKVVDPNKYHWKIRARLSLLVTQIALEMRMPVPKLLKRKVHVKYESSEFLNTIYCVTHQLLTEKLILNTVIECPIDGLTIPGVTVEHENGVIHIDVLDNKTRYRNSNIANGLLNFKLRLLSRLRYRQLLFDGNIFKEYDQRGLEDRIRKDVLDYISFGKAASLHNS